MQYLYSNAEIIYEYKRELQYWREEDDFFSEMRWDKLELNQTGFNWIYAPIDSFNVLIQSKNCQKTLFG
jgi:hypothetical protein